MKNWKRFVEQLGPAKQVSVVGPMYNRTFVPVGPTIYVDGGCHYQPLSGGDGNIPTIAVGDGDSTDLKLDVVLPKDKDYSDLGFVLKSLPKTVRHVELHGFLGGRRDHELINYGEANQFLKNQKKFTTVRFDEAVVAFSGGSLKLHVTGLFSLVVFEESTVRIMGSCQYPLNLPTKLSPVSSVGLSNIGLGTIVFESSQPCFLFLS